MIAHRDSDIDDVVNIPLFPRLHNLMHVPPHQFSHLRVMEAWFWVYCIVQIRDDSIVFGS